MIGQQTKIFTYQVVPLIERACVWYPINLIVVQERNQLSAMLLNEDASNFVVYLFACWKTVLVINRPYWEHSVRIPFEFFLPTPCLPITSLQAWWRWLDKIQWVPFWLQIPHQLAYNRSQTFLYKRCILHQLYPSSIHRQVMSHWEQQCLCCTIQAHEQQPHCAPLQLSIVVKQCLNISGSKQQIQFLCVFSTANWMLSWLQ